MTPLVKGMALRESWRVWLGYPTNPRLPPPVPVSEKACAVGVKPAERERKGNQYGVKGPPWYKICSSLFTPMIPAGNPRE